jgi:hypothetical protein
VLSVRPSIFTATCRMMPVYCVRFCHSENPVAEAGDVTDEADVQRVYAKALEFFDGRCRLSGLPTAAGPATIASDIHRISLKSLPASRDRVEPKHRPSHMSLCCVYTMTASHLNRCCAHAAGRTYWSVTLASVASDSSRSCLLPVINPPTHPPTPLPRLSSSFSFPLLS